MVPRNSYSCNSETHPSIIVYVLLSNYPHRTCRQKLFFVSFFFLIASSKRNDAASRSAKQSKQTTLRKLYLYTIQAPGMYVPHKNNTRAQEDDRTAASVISGAASLYNIESDKPESFSETEKRNLSRQPYNEKNGIERPKNGAIHQRKKTHTYTHPPTSKAVLSIIADVRVPCFFFLSAKTNPALV